MSDQRASGSGHRPVRAAAAPGEGTRAGGGEGGAINPNPKNWRAGQAAGGGRIASWLEQRTGYGAFLSLVLDEPISGGARWWYVFGSVLSFLLTLEFVTGVLLATAYAPSATTAWASTAFIQDTLSLGWFVRGLHSFGSSALIIVTGAHLAQVVVFGAYRAPREMTWLFGLAMAGLLLASALTGFALPWDDRGYWAKQVETSIVGTIPGVGAWMQTLLQGGTVYGNYTVTRFYTLHSFVLPGSLVALLVAHVLLVRRHGLTPKWGLDEETLARRTQAYWPHQAWRDTTASGVAFVILALLVVRAHGADLDGPVDPSGSTHARPEWYALPLYQLRKSFEGSLEVLATLVIPAAVALLLGVLPWLDRGPSRSPWRRKAVLGGAFAGAVGLGVLAYLPLRHDAADPAFLRSKAEATSRARLARELAKDGVPAEGGLAVFRNDPKFHARELWNEHCARCHSFTGDLSAAGDGLDQTTKRGDRQDDADQRALQSRGKEGPDFKGYNSRQWIGAYLRNPDSPIFMGGAHFANGMQPVQGSDEELRALTELVYAETGAADVDKALIAEAQSLFSEKDCSSCHEMDGESASTGPNLKGRGTLAYIVDIISDASDRRLFGKRNKMPRFAGKLAPDDIAELARFVVEEARSR